MKDKDNERADRKNDSYISSLKRKKKINVTVTTCIFRKYPADGYSEKGFEIPKGSILILTVDPWCGKGKRAVRGKVVQPDLSEI